MKYSFLKNPLLIAAVFSISITGCETGNVKNNVDTTSRSVDSLDRNPSILALGGTGMLDILYVPVDSFKKLDENKAVFIFHFGTNDLITVHGWNDKGKKQTPDTPVIKLLSLKKSINVAYGTETYFGNLVIHKVNDLQKKLKIYKYVIFEPHILGNHIYYNIYGSQNVSITEWDPKAFMLLGEANPSPPKPFDEP